MGLLASKTKAAGGGGVGFDYYISTTGSDSNNGLTTGTAWTIDALRTKTATIANKRVGLLDGTYRPAWANYATMPGDDNPDILPIAANGVTIESVNARMAVLTTNDGADNYPQSSDTGGAHSQFIGLWGDNITLRAVTITDLAFYGVHVGGDNCLIEECEIHDIDMNRTDISDTNIGVINTSSSECLNLTIRNNKLHNVLGTSFESIIGNFYDAEDTVVIEYNEIHNSEQSGQGVGVYLKSDNGSCIVRYNFIHDIETAVKGAGDVDDGKFSGSLYRVHNNLMLAKFFSGPNGVEGDAVVAATVEIYNNTFIANASNATSYAYFCQEAPLSSSGAGNTVSHYNNIYWMNGFSGEGVRAFGPNAGDSGEWFDLCDYNIYSPDNWILPDITTGSLATWSGTTGFDVNSTTTAPTFTTTPVTLPAHAVLQTSSSGYAGGATPGSTDGTVSGLDCDMGCWGGASPPSRIGTDW